MVQPPATHAPTMTFLTALLFHLHPSVILVLSGCQSIGNSMGAGKPVVFRSWGIQVWVWCLKSSTCVIHMVSQVFTVLPSWAQLANNLSQFHLIYSCQSLLVVQCSVWQIIVKNMTMGTWLINWHHHDLNLDNIPFSFSKFTTNNLHSFSRSDLYSHHNNLPHQITSKFFVCFTSTN
jgi:hypothetical protein